MRRSIFSKIHLHVKVVDILKTCSSDKGESPIYGKYKIVSHSVGRKNVFFYLLQMSSTLQYLASSEIPALL